MINKSNNWFFDGKLENSGLGRNYGVDLTFEKYLSRGFYYMATFSLFNTEYKAADGIWRDTHYNRNYAANFLIGKEWQLGSNHQNLLSVNARVSYQGGDHYSPINKTASLTNESVVYDETNAFSKQFPAALTSHFTIAYTINKQKTSHEIALKVINANMYKEFSDFEYNYTTQKVDERREALVVPNISYKIEF